MVVVTSSLKKLQSKVILMRRHEEKLAAIPPPTAPPAISNDQAWCLPPAKGKNARFPEQTVVITGALPRHGAGCRALARDGAGIW